MTDAHHTSRRGLRKAMKAAEPLGWSSDAERDAWYAGYDARVEEETRSTRSGWEARCGECDGTGQAMLGGRILGSCWFCSDCDGTGTTPPTDAGSITREGGEGVASFLTALADGSLVREILAAGAIIDVMTGGKFDWRGRINDSDFTSSADWMTALEYARAALATTSSPDASPDSGAQRHQKVE